ncbi:MAG: leucyl/phenylalanyl-tRNA--protein transferase [Gallionella sp.]
MIAWLREDTPFPAAERALRTPNGLLAAGGDLSASRLLDAYRRGIFPWFNPGEPILWWSPDPRMVLIPEEFRVSRSLAKLLRKSFYEIRTDTVFERVMRGCAAPRRGHHGTWIGEDMIAAYCGLHRSGHAHSVETWINGELAGGLYGVCIGHMFYAESMYSEADNASKIALAHLAAQFARWHPGSPGGSGAGMIDCQMYTPHLASLGAREIPRGEFLARLKELVHCDPITDWRFDTDLFK